MKLLCRSSSVNLLFVAFSISFMISECDAGRLFSRRNNQKCCRSYRTILTESPQAIPSYKVVSTRVLPTQSGAVKTASSTTSSPTAGKPSTSKQSSGKSSLFRLASHRRLNTDPCICVRFEFMNFGTFQLYVAHSYDDCPDAAGCDIGFDTVYIAGNNLSPQTCPDECSFVTRLSELKTNLSEQPKLSEPVNSEFDLFTSDYPPCKLNATGQINCEKACEDKVYQLSHPESGQPIRVTVSFIDVTTGTSHCTASSGRVAFGLEVEDDGTDAIEVTDCERLQGFDGYLYQFDLDGLPCTVITTVP